jgi:hypothetical protein
MRGLAKVLKLIEAGLAIASAMRGGRSRAPNSAFSGLTRSMRAMRRFSTLGGTPKCRSSPSGEATSSAKTRPSVRPSGSTRRISSPMYQPSEMPW